jgi:hypothetical protein
MADQTPANNGPDAMSEQARTDPAPGGKGDTFCVHPWMHFRFQADGELPIQEHDLAKRLPALAADALF